MKIYLVTHAHTEPRADAAADTWQLSARGRAEARRLGAHEFWHEIDLVVVSSEPKTWLTVDEVKTARNLPVRIDSRLDEIRRTGWIEDYAEHVREVFLHADQSVGGWESITQVQQRSCAALDDLQRRFAGRTVAVVGHGICLSVVRATILGDAQVDFGAWQRLPFAAIARITWSPRVMAQDFDMGDHRAR